MGAKTVYQCNFCDEGFDVVTDLFTVVPVLLRPDWSGDSFIVEHLGQASEIGKDTVILCTKVECLYKAFLKWKEFGDGIVWGNERQSHPGGPRRAAAKELP